MNEKEAFEWLNGERSMTNIIPQHPFETWQVRVAEADAAMMQQAYWLTKARKEGLIVPLNPTNVSLTLDAPFRA